MFKFAIKNLLTRKSKAIITIVAIFISAMLILFSYNITNQINDGLVNTASYYDIVVGPAGSSTDLVLSAMFFTGSITDTISEDVYEKIQKNNNILQIVPIATGDNFKGVKIIGTTPALLKGKNLQEGKIFEKELEIVIGNNIAEKYNLKLGDNIVASHGVSEDESEHKGSPYVVAGILEKTHTIYDDTLFTDYKSVWEIHGAHVDSEHRTEKLGYNEENEHEEEEHKHNNEYTALMIKSRNPSAALNLIDEINEMPGVLAVNPSATLRKVMENIDTTTIIVYVLCFVIAIMSFVIISMINIMVMQDLKKDIILMRLLGLKRSVISKIVIIQNMIVSSIAIVLSFISTRICLELANQVTSSMGVVMNAKKVYGGELYILILVFIVSLLPMSFGLMRILRRELGNEK